MKNTHPTTAEGREKIGLFEPVHLHEKLLLTLVGVVILVGFVVVLVMYAQPTPTGSAVESKQAKAVYDRISEVGGGGSQTQGAGLIGPAPTTDPGAGSNRAAVSSTSASAALQTGSGMTITVEQPAQPAAKGQATAQNTPADTNPGAVKQLVNTLQTGLSPTSIHL